MRINVDWLRDWVEITVTPEELADELTTAGLEVDSVTPAAPAITGVRVAEVLAVDSHPKADRLSVCRVGDGGAEHVVVCGAPNVAVGIKAPFAPVGTDLPDGRTISAATIRGVESEGMLCSARELGLGDDGSGLLLLDPSVPAGTPLEAYLRLPDAVLDVDLTPNRGDCFSALGIAREVAARHGTGVSGPALDPVAGSSQHVVAVELEDGAACPRFAGRVISGLARDAVSPDWLKERLRRAGLRPIHPVVDVTNYVMLDLGQPLHAYSLDKLTGGIKVRFARDGERLTLLDGSEVDLAADVLAITDESGPIALAGIMGGASTAVDAASTDIFLESAFFSPSAIQGRARRYGLHTDASVRFERGVDPEHQGRAIERATRLLLEIAGGEPGPTIVKDAAGGLPRRSAITLHHERAEALLGVPLDHSAVPSLLSPLGMEVEPGEGCWSVTPPSHRFDVTIEEDLIEELGRMIGYDAIEPIEGSMPSHPGNSSERSVPEDRVTDLLVERGYSEAISYSFIDAQTEAWIAADETVRLANPISSELGVLRGSLWPGLLECARQNMSRQQARCRLFEVGTVFASEGGRVRESTMVAGLVAGALWPEHWDLDGRDADFFDVKADVEALLALTHREREFELEARAHPALSPAASASIEVHGEVVGWIGAIHPELQRAHDLKCDAIVFSLDIGRSLGADIPAYETYSRYPFVRRDLAVVVDDDVRVRDLKKLVEETVGARLRRVVVFDLYRGESIGSSRKSVGIGLILQDASRTLTDDDADGMVDAVVGRLERELKAIIRT